MIDGKGWVQKGVKQHYTGNDQKSFDHFNKYWLKETDKRFTPKKKKRK